MRLTQPQTCPPRRDHLHQELEIGLRSVAVPVVDRAGVVVGAINVGTQALRADLAELRERFMPRLQQAALAIMANT